MSRVAVDTSVLVAALLGWHESHGPAFRFLKNAIEDGDVVIPAQVLVEAYAVMTRLPSPHRVAPARALDLLEGSLEGRITVLETSAGATWKFLRRASEKGIAGGAAYDAAILASAAEGGAVKLLTLDESDFRRFGDSGVEIVVPS